MYENLTPEYIKSDILENIHLADTREGSYTNEVVTPLAYEIWRTLQSLDAVEPMVYVDETSGIYIDKSAAAYGMARKPGTKAKAEAAFHGADGTIVLAGKVFLTADSLQYTLDANVTITGGEAHGTLTAAEAGSAYNVPAGAIFRQLVNQPGLETVESGEAAGGSDPESDAALVARYNEYRRSPSTSGNAAHYRQWALEVDGIAAAKVAPLWDGPGTVKVLVVGAGNQPVDGAIVAECAAHIEQVRPIGAEVTVLSATGRPIDVDAVVTIKPSTDIASVSEAFAAALGAYLESIAFTEYVVVYNRVGYMLLDIPGVVDFASLSVNGGTADVSIGDDEVPVPGEIGVSL